MKIILTGGTGYLGSHLVQSRLAQGDELACIVRDAAALKRLEPYKNQVTLIETCEKGSMREQIETFAPEVVLHTACTYDRGGNTIESVLSGNLFFPLEILRIVSELGAVRWINTDTCLPASLNAYALAKSQFVQWGQFYANLGKIDFINLKLEHFYGPNEPENHFIGWVIRKLKAHEPLDLTAGTQKRDFIYLQDVLEIINQVIEIPIQAPFFEIPVGTGIMPTIREVVEYISSITHSKSELRF